MLASRSLLGSRLRSVATGGGVRTRGAALCGQLVLCELGACGPSASPRDVDVSVDIGVPGGEDGLAFVPLIAGGEVPLETFGQGGTHALLAVRCQGLGDSAFVSVAIASLATGAEVVAPAGPAPRLLICRGGGACDLLPLLVMTGGLAPPGTARDGLQVLIRAEAHNAEGLGASVEREAVLTVERL